MNEYASLIIFDTDGTLIDTRRAVIDAVADGLATTYRHFELPVPALDRERIALAMGLPSGAFFRTAFAPDTVPAEMHDRFASEFELRSTRAEVAALRGGGSQLYPEAEATLAALRERGHVLALFSNATEPYFRTVVQAHRLERWFSRTLSLEYAVRNRLARHKKGMVRHLARGFAAVAVVGDRIHDMEAGRAIGAQTVGCRYGFGDPSELELAHWVIDCLAELPQLPIAALPPATSPTSRREVGRG